MHTTYLALGTMLAVSSVAGTTAAHAQFSTPRKMEKNVPVVLTFPASLVDKSELTPTYVLAETDSGVTVNGKLLEGSFGLPDGEVYTKYAAAKWRGGREYVTLRDAKKRQIYVHVPAPSDSVAERILARAIAPAARREAVFDSMTTASANLLFRGRLQALLPLTIRTLHVSRVTMGRAPAVAFALVTAVDSVSLQVLLGTTKYSYNDLQMGASERAARAIETDVLPAIKGYALVYAALADTVPTVMLRILVSHRSFSSPVSETQYDMMSVSFPMQQIVAFVNAEITAQALIDDGRVLIDNALVKPRLAP